MGLFLSLIQPFRTRDTSRIWRDALATLEPGSGFLAMNIIAARNTFDDCKGFSRQQGYHTP